MSTMPEDSFPLRMAHGAVVSSPPGGGSGGHIVLDMLPAGAFVTEDISSDHGAVILGLNSTEGPTSLLDIKIGQVGFGGGGLSSTDVCVLVLVAYDFKFLSMLIKQLKVQRMLACARCKLWWMTPEWRTSTLQLPPETQFLLAELSCSGGGSSSSNTAVEAYALLLPLIDGDFRTTLRAGR
jgi:raffinose synthase